MIGRVLWAGVLLLVLAVALVVGYPIAAAYGSVLGILDLPIPGTRR